ncbi:hypothetical protein BDDG_11914 [Blastomyces dermatitidis ATCC 18188]|uniref:Flavin-containing monooxygenase 1 n=1 Tax=Ajellomyces dermatitidis (strain ATCC 18188 / CBS 674.68) TaxID=653446 RepID=A0A0J9EM06_AJEDA|nr:hypothetical protein BDDG_11914 [Blastomyces dermatitidis ATCC 18188]
MATKKVAIIGGGPSGLTTLKQCLAEGLDAVLFEVRGGIGGQWRYEDPNPETDDAISSIYEGVILNSTRDTSGFSDFPIDPAQYPEYFGHRRMLNYLEKYAEHFGLGKYMRLNTKVMSCNQRPDGRWTVVHQEKGADQVTSEYDAIFACSGHNSYPSTPVFEGMSSFQGDILHSHVYRRPARFDGKKVALIGFGSSAVDLACELVSVAKEVHMITRRGGWVIPRFVLGQPVELYDNRIAETLIPGGLSQWIQTKILNFAIGEHPEVIKPHHGIMEANPTVHSNLIEYIKVGKIHAHRAGVKQFNETSLVLTNDTVLDVDTVICCTGYNMDMPYLSKETYHAEDNPILKSPTPWIYISWSSPHDLLIFSLSAQARWASAILTGRVKLPSMDEMNRQVKEYQEELVRTAQRNISKTEINCYHRNQKPFLTNLQMVVSDRHTATVRFLPYCDSLLADLDANPTIVRLLHKLFTSNPFRAFSLLKAVYFGVNSPAQYRLFGHGQKEELAAATLVRLNAGTGISVKEKELIDGQVRY